MHLNQNELIVRTMIYIVHCLIIDVLKSKVGIKQTRSLVNLLAVELPFNQRRRLLRFDFEENV